MMTRQPLSELFGADDQTIATILAQIEEWNDQKFDWR